MAHETECGDSVICEGFDNLLTLRARETWHPCEVGGLHTFV